MCAHCSWLPEGLEDGVSGRIDGGAEDFCIPKLSGMHGTIWFITDCSQIRSRPES